MVVVDEQSRLRGIMRVPLLIAILHSRGGEQGPCIAVSIKEINNSTIFKIIGSFPAFSVIFVFRPPLAKYLQIWSFVTMQLIREKKIETLCGRKKSKKENKTELAFPKTENRFCYTVFMH